MNSKSITKLSLLVAIICVLSPFAINVGVVPISLSTLAIYFAGLILNKKESVFAVVVYILLGCVGLPIFSNFRGGFNVLVGVTGGFIVGYIPLVFIVSLFNKNNFLRILGLVLGTIICYTFGIIQFIILTKNSVIQSLSICVLPFIIGDIIKIAVAIIFYKTTLEKIKK